MLKKSSDKNKSMAKYNEVEPNMINQIRTGTEIKGDVITTGDIRFDGKLTGNMSIKGKLVIGDTGEVKGEITCKNADVSGKINGKITVSELLELKASSKIHGDIITNKLSIEPGAEFTGNCNMSSSTMGTYGSAKHELGKKEKDDK